MAPADILVSFGLGALVLTVESDALVEPDTLVGFDALEENEPFSVQELVDMLDAVASLCFSTSPYALHLRPVWFCPIGTTSPNKPGSQHQALSKSMVFPVLQRDQSAAGHCQRTFSVRGLPCNAWDEQTYTRRIYK